MNAERTWRMRAAHWGAALIGASLVATLTIILVAGGEISGFVVIAISGFLGLLLAYIFVGARFLSRQPSPGAGLARTMRFIGWWAIAAVVALAALTVAPLLLIDNSVVQTTPGGTALIVLLMAMALALGGFAIVLGKWLGSLKELEREHDV